MGKSSTVPDKSTIDAKELQLTQEDAASEGQAALDEAPVVTTSRFSIFARQGFRDLSSDTSGEGA